jgi:hypothetical protein
VGDSARRSWGLDLVNVFMADMSDGMGVHPFAYPLAEQVGPAARNSRQHPRAGVARLATHRSDGAALA